MPLEDRAKLGPALLDAMKVFDEEDAYLTLRFFVAYYDLMAAEDNQLAKEVYPILEKYHSSVTKAIDDV